PRSRGQPADRELHLLAPPVADVAPKDIGYRVMGGPETVGPAESRRTACRLPWRRRRRQNRELAGSSGGWVQDRPRAAPALVGRGGGLGELVAGSDDGGSGGGRLFLLAAGPGAGKSRLADEAAAHARDRGVKVAWGRCWEAGGAPAYWPWVQSLRACVRGLGSEDLRSYLGAGAPLVAQIVAEVAEMLPDAR